MTVMVGKLISIGGQPFGGEGHAVRIYSRITRTALEDQAVILQLIDRIEMPCKEDGGDGTFTTADMDPGPIRVELEGSSRHGEGWDINLPYPDPDDPQPWSLGSLIDLQADWDPPVVSRAEAAAREAARQAETAGGHAGVAAAHRKHMDEVVYDVLHHAADMVRGEVKDDADRAETSSKYVEGVVADGAAAVRAEVKDDADRSEKQAGLARQDRTAAEKAAGTAAADAVQKVDEKMSGYVSSAARDAGRAETARQGAETIQQGIPDKVGQEINEQFPAELNEQLTTELDNQLPAELDERVPPLVASSIADDRAVADAAAAAAGPAVDKELDTSPRIPRLATIPGYLGILVDGAGQPTDLSIRSSDGQLAEWVVKRLATRIGQYLDSLSDADVMGLISESPQVPRIQEAPGYLGVLVDADDTPTDLAVRSSDGQLAEWVVKRLAPRIAGYLPASGGGNESPDLTRFPVMGGRLATNRVNGNPSNFVFCGSSTTGNSEPTGYVSLVVDGLQERYPSSAGEETPTQFSTSADWATIHTGPGIHGYGAGVSGTTSANYLNATRVARIAALEPTAVLHMIGANDSLFSTTYAAYKANVESWIDQIDAATTLPVQHILVHTYPRWGQAVSGPNPDHYKYPWDGYGKVLEEIAEARANCGFIDNNPAFQAVGVDGSGSDPLDLILPDEVHATARGYRFIADLILEALTNIH